MQFELGTLLKIPRGTPGLQPMELELKEILEYEQRQKEEAYVNKETASELMHIFNKAYASTFRLMNQVSFEYNQAVKMANRRKSIVLLDIAPEMLKNKGLVTKRSAGGSKDLRDAVLDQDLEYSQLMDTVYALEAAFEFLKGKAKSFEMSYHAVKKVFDYNRKLGPDYNVNGEFDLPKTIGEPKYE